jgi:hypothetical protein
VRILKNYIILRGGTREHYFSAPGGGIYSHSMKNSFWTSPAAVSETAVGDFGLFKDENECVHIVGGDSSGNILYTSVRGEHIARHTLLSGRADIRVSDFQLTSSNAFLHLFYIAETGGVLFLVHCVLGNNSQPSVVSKISSRQFFIHGGRVYFSNEHSTLGFSDFSDGKPNEFIPLFEGSVFPYITGAGEQRHMIWKRGGDIVLDGDVVATDENAYQPIMTSGETLSVMWSSEGIVYYVAIDKNGTPSAPMRFISTGRLPTLFCVQNYGSIKYFYGTYSGSEVNIFGKSDIFEHSPDSDLPRGTNDIQRLKIMVDMMQKEILSIKNQLRLLRQITGSI